MKGVYEMLDALSVLEAMVAYRNLALHVLRDRRGEFTKTQMDILLGLRFIGSMNMTELSRHLAVSREQATRATSPLVAKGYVARTRSMGERRAVVVSLSEKGARYLDGELAVVSGDLERELEAADLASIERLLAATDRSCPIPRGIANAKRDARDAEDPMQLGVDSAIRRQNASNEQNDS